MVWKLLLDFGLVILIWMTQLVVYPSFTYFAESELVSWHARYTTAISFIVVPLMLLQVCVHGLQLIVGFSWIRVISIVFIGFAWINTFFYAVPLHNQISAGQSISEAAQALVSVNKYRVVCWSLVFLLGFWDYLKK